MHIPYLVFGSQEMDPRITIAMLHEDIIQDFFCQVRATGTRPSFELSIEVSSKGVEKRTRLRHRNCMRYFAMRMTKDAIIN